MEERPFEQPGRGTGPVSGPTDAPSTPPGGDLPATPTGSEVGPRRPFRHDLEPDISFLEKLKGPAIVLLATAVAALFVFFSTYAHYELDQAPHRMFKMLGGACFLAILFLRPEHTLLLLPFALPYSELLPKTPIPMVNSKNILMAALLLSWIGHGVIRGRRVVDPSPWNRPLLAFLLWSLASAVFGVFYMGDGASDLYPQLQSFWNEIMGFVLFFVTFNTVRTRPQIERIAFLYCVGAGLGALGVLNEYRDYSYGRRVGGGMGDINGAGAYFAGAIVFTLEMLAVRSRKMWQRVVLLGALAWSGVGLILPASRGAFVACGVSAGFLGFRGGPLRMFLVALTVVGIVVFTPAHVKKRFTETEAEVTQGEIEKSSSGRIDIWKATINVIERSPIVGVGWGQLPTAMEQTEYGGSRVAHNLYLECWAQGGIPGLLLVLILFGVATREGWALRREKGFAGHLGNAFVYYMITLMIANIFGGRLFSVYSSGALSVLAALVFRMRVIVEDERQIRLSGSDGACTSSS